VAASPAEDERYRRHRSLFTDAQWGALTGSRIVVAGCGGLGSHVLDLLVRMAPLNIELWDGAILDAPDLNRQSLYTPADLGLPKVVAARRRLDAVNPDCRISIRREYLRGASEPGETLGGIDCCFDCLDSFRARCELEKALIASARRYGMASIPLFHGGISGYHGQTAVLLPPETGYSRIFGPDFDRIEDASKEAFPAAAAMAASMQVSAWAAWVRGEREAGTLYSLDCRRPGVERIGYGEQIP
jgi:molybdopterin/thiamine biosynthesis adenylyltransferase